MKKNRNPFILPALGMIIVLLIAVSALYRFTQAEDKAASLSLEEAKDIALNDAGEQLNQVTFTRAHLDKDSGVSIYEIDFYTDNNSYEYEISAQTGNIRDKEITAYQKESSSGEDQDAVDTPSQGQEKSSEVIGVKKAQAIALAAAKLAEDQVTFTKTNLDTENGRLAYEIEFIRNNQEYEYDVDAYTGAILSYDIDLAEKLPAKSTVGNHDHDDDDHDDDDHDDDDHDDDHDHDDD